MNKNRGNFCEKWQIAVQEGNVTMQENLISALGMQLQITKAQALSILRRFCEKRPTGTPDVTRWCNRYLAVMASGRLMLWSTILIITCKTVVIIRLPPGLPVINNGLFCLKTSMLVT